MGLVCLGQIRTISTVPDVRACLFRRNEINGFDSFRRREAGPLLSLFRQQSMAKSWSVWKVWLHIISCSSSSFSCRSLACCYVTLYRRCASRWLVLVFAFLLWLSFACFCVVVEFILCNLLQHAKEDVVIWIAKKFWFDGLAMSGHLPVRMYVNILV